MCKGIYSRNMIILLGHCESGIRLMSGDYILILLLFMNLSIILSSLMLGCPRSFFIVGVIVFFESC